LGGAGQSAGVFSDGPIGLFGGGKTFVVFLLCYLRGPAGIIVALAEQIG